MASYLTSCRWHPVIENGAIVEGRSKCSGVLTFTATSGDNKYGPYAYCEASREQFKQVHTTWVIRNVSPYSLTLRGLIFDGE